MVHRGLDPGSSTQTAAATFAELVKTQVMTIGFDAAFLSVLLFVACVMPCAILIEIVLAKREHSHA